MARLTAAFWVQAYLMRLGQEAIAAYVVARGDPVAGAVVVKLARLDGTAQAFQRSVDPATSQRVWMVLAEGAEAEVDAVLARQRARDPDVWVIEVEDAAGRHRLDQPGLD